MGQIIHSKVLPNKKVIFKMLLDLKEMENLQGHMKNINIFAANLCNKSSNVNTRGNNGVTKYFRIPLSIRSRKKSQGTLKYQKLEFPSQLFYIYTLEKEQA